MTIDDCHEKKDRRNALVHCFSHQSPQKLSTDNGYVFISMYLHVSLLDIHASQTNTKLEYQVTLKLITESFQK
jgi:hypothetical protein